MAGVAEPGACEDIQEPASVGGSELTVCRLMMDLPDRFVFK
jgi:hypothetical protein